jgi:immunoglobulin-like protein involved in spore germination
MKARKYFEQNRAAAFVGFTLILVLVIGLAIIIPLSLRGSTPATKPTPTPTTGAVTPTPTAAENTPTPVPGVVMGPQACPDAVKGTAYWDTILGTQGSGSKVVGVSCANVLGSPSLQSLVTVRHNDASSTLDVYVFNNITSAKPTQIFKLQGLLKGDAKISGYNTIMTAQVDQNSSLNAGKPASQWTADLYREFEWNAGEGTLAQVAFPGIFPDLTRYQAENDQALVNKGQDTWKNDPQQVAQKLALKFFEWKRAVTTTLLSGGGPQDVYATVRVQEPPVQGAQSQGPSAVVTLSRLEGNTHNFWVAISVVDENKMLTLTNIESRSLIASPVTFEGTGAAFEATIGRAVVYDHQFADIGHAQVTGDKGIGKANYSIKVVYNTSFHQGVQEGIVAVYENNGGISDENYTAAMVKVLLDPEPGVALGPVSGPDALQKAGYWAPIIGIDTKVASVGTVTFANMKGDPSLQALVPVYHTDGSLIVDIYVYDQIMAAHPVQIFSLKGLDKGGALISGYSTVMTTQGDVYREYKWSDGAGTLVPVAFPGIFPDLTRYQAEMDQKEVSLGKDPWKMNPAQVAQRLAAKFFKWAPNAPTSLVSGGGPHDVEAVVQVQSTYAGGGKINVQLSRLEGNTANMWVVIGVEDGNGLLTITSPQARDRMTSPITIKGAGSSFEGQIGQAFVLDRLYATIGQAKVSGVSNGKTTYTTTVSYTQKGFQEGVVAVYTYSQADGSIASAVMVKEMLS